MFSFLSIIADFRAAQAALAAADFPKVAAVAADLMAALGMTSLADHVRGELAAVGTGDARDIAENALGAVADLVNAAFSFGKPITVSAAASAAVPLTARCDAAIAHCEQADSPKAKAAKAGAAGAFDLSDVIKWVALLAPVFERLFAAFLNRRPVSPV